MIASLPDRKVLAGTRGEPNELYSKKRWCQFKNNFNPNIVNKVIANYEWNFLSLAVGSANVYSQDYISMNIIKPSTFQRWNNFRVR